MLVAAAALSASCAEGNRIHNSCEDWNWNACRTFVLQPGVFGHDRCKNPWHELVVDQGVPMCRCKRRPECDPQPK